MSFDSREASLDAGKPIELYRFRRGVISWAYNSSDRDMSFNNETYKGLRGGISNDGIRRTGEVSADRLKITAPADLEVAALYRGVPPSVEIRLTIYEHHYGESDAKAVWNGTIESVGWPALDRCLIAAQPLTSTLDVPGLRLTWDRSCGASLYDRRCKVNRDLFRVDLTIQSMTGASVSTAVAAGFEDGWYDGGFIEWPVGMGEYDRRTIELHQGSVLHIMGGTAGLVVGMALRCYPGCNRTAPVCHLKYDNLDNMRADPNMMGKNIFNGEPVF
jgi:uncharacterized phage protein (TIGR02218 family)